MFESPNPLENARYSNSIIFLIERISGAIALYTSALLIIAESVLLGMGVFYRYVLHSPIVWSDELALILFAWLGMMGAVIALRNRKHMRLTFLVSKTNSKFHELIDTFSNTSIFVILTALFVSSIHYTIHSLPELTPALQISAAYRTAALNVGLGMMLLTSITQLIGSGSIKKISMSFLIISIMITIVWLAAPILLKIGNYNLVFFFVILVFLLISAGVEIAFAFAASALCYLIFLIRAPTSIIMNRLDAALSDIILLSIPMFIFLGVLIELTGVARALINVLVAMVGNIRGGLHYVLLVSMYLVSGISGSKSADMAAIVPILFPEMKRRGENEGELVSLLSSSAAMAETIPPSLILIAVGVAASLSISDLFIAGLVPAVVGMIALGVVVYFRTLNNKIEKNDELNKFHILKLLMIAIPAFLLPMLIRASVVEGIATATEVATIGVIYSILCGLFIYRQFPLNRFLEAFKITASLTGAIMLVTGLAGGMAWSLTQSGFSDDLITLLKSIPGGWVTYMIVSIIFFAVIGSILEGYPAIVMFSPLMFPIAEQLNIHPIHYAMVVVLSMSIGLFAPPVGVGFYSACALAHVHPDKALKDIWVYMGAFTVAVFVVAFVPWLSIGFLD